MCFSNPTSHSTSIVRSSLPPAGKIIAYSSHQLRAFNHVNQVGKQTGKNAKISKIIPYDAIATMRNLKINKKKQSGQDITDPKCTNNIFVKPSTQCKIGTINAWSIIKNKETFLAQEIKTNNLDLRLIMETWKNDTEEDRAWLHQSDLTQSEYTISTHNRPTREGGIALLYKDHMEVRRLQQTSTCNRICNLTSKS